MRTLKETALKIAGNAKQYSDCYLAIEYLLSSMRPLGDEHSFFMKAAEMKNWESEGSQVSKPEPPSYKIIDNYGYILVPPFHGGNPQKVLAYADSMQLAIQKLFNAGIKGWIVDLRSNTGGNMTPMVAGLGPLFSKEKLGSLMNVEGKFQSWYYSKGNYYWDNETDTALRVSNPITLPARLPIAVLIGNSTGSSGEAVTISFIGNEKTILLGQPTWGLTTGNQSFAMKDGSQIFLSSTIMVDRNGKLYHKSIDPDTLIVEKKGEANDPGITAAIDWLRLQH
jgi:C-terminal processing protease CtpA/Prc